jgi:hypothetical protein
MYVKSSVKLCWEVRALAKAVRPEPWNPRMSDDQRLKR